MGFKIFLKKKSTFENFYRFDSFTTRTEKSAHLGGFLPFFGISSWATFYYGNLPFFGKKPGWSAPPCEESPGGSVQVVRAHVGSLFHGEKIAAIFGLAFYKVR